MRGGDPPLIAGRIHGVRVWSVGWDTGDGELLGFGDSSWATGGEPTEARCLAGARRSWRGDPHGAPAGDCSCGLYAVHPFGAADHLRHFSPLGQFPDAIPGVIEAWGQVELHEDGFRAQFARPVALTLVRAWRGTDIGLAIERLADRYGAEVVEVGDERELAEYCRERGLGLSEAVVRSLLPTDPDPDPPDSASPARPSRPRSPALSRLGSLGEILGTIVMCVVALVWYGGLAAIAIAVLMGVGQAVFEPPNEEFSGGHLRVVDQALLGSGRETRYVAIVRNTSAQRVALGVFPSGAVRDRDGAKLVRLDDRARIDLRPSLLPGETGVVIDSPRRGGAAADATELRNEVEMLARREQATGRSPIDLGRSSFDREPCRLTVVIRRSSVSRVDIALVGRDRAGAIAGAGTVSLRRIPAGRSRQRLLGPKPDECPDWLRGVDVYPQLLPAQVLEPPSSE